MEIIGRGFLAGRLATIADRHPTVTVLAAGVSSTRVRSGAEFRRERELVCATAARCAREGRALVFLSTAAQAMYGHAEIPAREGDTVAPDSLYGRHKADLERVVLRSGAPWLVLRLSHVVGPGQRPHQLLPDIIRQIRSGVVRVYRGAHRDLIDVLDVVRALDGLLSQGTLEEVVNVACGVPHPAQTIVRGIERHLDLAPRHEYVDVSPTLTRVSIEKLRALVPAVHSLSDDDYLDRVLERYVPLY
ncbi:NAD-dependent epimerase/dehydratase family protein [Nocardiopsis alba]|uniref:NAD-dependent epimerase/dehydratase family protein n=1 Tax=Nocardiopsis alba TaxID=53437 RepID=UPI003660F6EA